MQKKPCFILDQNFESGQKKCMSISENSTYYRESKSDFLTLLDNGLKNEKSD